jgi:hypothetical protein
MTPTTHLLAALAELRERLRENEVDAAQLRKAIKDLEDLLPPTNIGRVTLQITNPTNETRTPETIRSVRSQADESIARRPLLRDGIPRVLSLDPAGMTIRALADELSRRQWIGGTYDESRTEIVRQALSALKRARIVESEIPVGEKAAIWRLSNPGARD